MEIFNPQSVKKADLVVGIPSYNEEKTIGFVTEQVAKGLKKYYPQKRSVIINVDNNSTDRTREAFLFAKSSIPQIFYITTPKGTKGKGYNFYSLFTLFKDLKAKAGIVVDADLKSIKPVWMKKFADPIFSGYDYISPLYARKKDDATITNNLVFPLVYGLLGVNIRQPIGGEFAFSNKLVNIWLDKKWHPTTYQFGIDIFMSLNAILSGLKIGQVSLGEKIHKSSTPNLGPMFIQVTETLFGILKENTESIKKIKKVKEIPVLGDRRSPHVPNNIPDNTHFERLFREEFDLNRKWFKECLSSSLYSQLEKMEKKGEVEIDSEMWIEIVYSFLYHYDEKKNSETIEALRCLYFGRIANYFKKIAKLTPEQAEEKVMEQAELFFERRGTYLEKIN